MGALILVTFPSIVIQIMLTITLLGLAIQSVFKAIEITKKENREKKARLSAQKVSPEQKTQVDGDVEMAKDQESKDKTVNATALPILQPIIGDEIGEISASPKDLTAEASAVVCETDAQLVTLEK